MAHETAGHNYGRAHPDGLLSSPKTLMLHNYCGGGASGWYTNPNIWVNGKRLLGDGAECQDAMLEARTLARLGYSRVVVFEGGMQEWRRHGLPEDHFVPAG